MIAATPKNLEWLFEKLYEAKRVIEVSEPSLTHPVFVLLTKTPDERHKIENEIYAYFVRKYGTMMYSTKVMPSTGTATLTRLELAEIGASVLLMDVGD